MSKSKKRREPRPTRKPTLAGKLKRKLDQAKADRRIQRIIREVQALSRLRLPEPTTELVVDPTRKYRFDIAWPKAGIAVELHGGTWSGGRHGTGSGLASDCEKILYAAEQGYTVIPMTYAMAKDPKVLKRLAGIIQEGMSWRGLIDRILAGGQ